MSTEFTQRDEEPRWGSTEGEKVVPDADPGDPPGRVLGPEEVLGLPADSPGPDAEGELEPGVGSPDAQP